MQTVSEHLDSMSHFVDFRYVTNSAYGFTIGRMICLGFVQHPDTIKGNPQVLENSWLLDRKAVWSVNIAGNMVRHLNRIFIAFYAFKSTT